MDYRKESDARIVIDDLLRRAGWDPADKSMVETEALRGCWSVRQPMKDKA